MLMEEIMATRSPVSFGSIFARVLQSTTGFFNARRDRRELSRLVDLDDRMLADIGLTRTNLTLALAEPLSVDASVGLAAIARQSGSQTRPAFHAADRRSTSESRWAA